MNSLETKMGVAHKSMQQRWTYCGMLGIFYRCTQT